MDLTPEVEAALRERYGKIVVINVMRDEEKIPLVLRVFTEAEAIAFSDKRDAAMEDQGVADYEDDGDEELIRAVVWPVKADAEGREVPDLGLVRAYLARYPMFGLTMGHAARALGGDVEPADAPEAVTEAILAANGGDRTALFGLKLGDDLIVLKRPERISVKAWRRQAGRKITAQAYADLGRRALVYPADAVTLFKRWPFLPQQLGMALFVRLMGRLEKREGK